MSVYEPIADLVHGTALPAVAPSEAAQPEGRGTIVPKPMSDAAGVSLFEKIGNRDDISPHEQAIVGAALRAYDRAPKRERTIFDSVGDQTDPTTGNMVVQLYEVPQGSEGRITSVTVDAPRSATITPAAPYANAASFMYIAVLSPGSNPDDAGVVTSRAGLVAFAPVSAGGPVLPGQWTFNDDEAPVAWGGQAFFFVFVGGSIGAVTNLALQVSYRVNLYSV